MNTIKKITQKNRAFTIVEMLVVMGIFVIISGIVLFNYTNFKSSASIENLAQDIALNIRKAQVFALGVKGAGNGGTTIFPGYGVRFNLPNGVPPPMSGDSKSFIFFANIVPPIDNEYNHSNPTCSGNSPTANQECMDVISITTNDTITALCNDTTCYDAGNGAPSLDIVFNRPEPEAFFCLKTGGNPQCATTGMSNVSIKVKSELNIMKVITVWNTGQIVVK